MRKTAGFTLIELVIVIVILGILGAVAAPKFLNLQGDAYGANLNALKSSMESASTLANTKAILGGEDRGEGNSITINDNGVSSAVSIDNGYPAATVDGILQVLNIEADSKASAATTTKPYIYEEGTNEFNLSPAARQDDECKVTYSKANAGERPKIEVIDTNC